MAEAMGAVVYKKEFVRIHEVKKRNNHEKGRTQLPALANFDHLVAFLSERPFYFGTYPRPYISRKCKHRSWGLPIESVHVIVVAILPLIENITWKRHVALFVE